MAWMHLFSVLLALHWTRIECFRMTMSSVSLSDKSTARITNEYILGLVDSSFDIIKEDRAVELLNSIRTADVNVPSISNSPIRSSYAKYTSNQVIDTKESTRVAAIPTTWMTQLMDLVNNKRENIPAQGLVSQGRSKKRLPPIVLLHGFDSSCIEYRRLAPLLATLSDRDVYVPDILGWGFNDLECENINDFGPDAKMDHLESFIKQVIGGPVVVVGASLGGGIGITLSVKSPKLVDKLVLIDAQALIDGDGPKQIPQYLAKFGIAVLKSWPLRMFANILSYDDRRFATLEAVECGRLHTYTKSWESASIDFLKSGGFQISKLVPLITQDSLILWGRNDRILEPSTAYSLNKEIKQNELVWIEDCGHVPHLEQPELTANYIVNFINKQNK